MKELRVHGSFAIENKALPWVDSVRLRFLGKDKRRQGTEGLSRSDFMGEAHLRPRKRMRPVKARPL